MRRVLFAVLSVVVVFCVPSLAQNALIATTTAMSFSPSTIVYPASTMVTFKVTPASGVVEPSGSVELKAGTTVLATFPMSNGTYTTSLPTTGYPAGVYGLTATYEGNTVFAASTSPTVDVTLKSPVTVALTASPGTLSVGQTETLKATVAATDGGGTPSGTVSFDVGSTVLATLSLSGGVATLTAATNGYPAASYPITAVYNGDSLHATKTSSAVTVDLVSDPTISTSNTPSATEGSPYTETFHATGGTGSYTWSITSGLSSLENIGMSFTSGGVLSGTPNATGSYPYTVQVTDAATGENATAPYTLVVNSQTTGCGAGTYSITGTVSYSGAKTGRIYVGLGSSCGGGTQGTSIASAGAFTIRGVPPGTYSLAAFMDILGYGSANTADPTGASNAITITDANVTGASITLTDPGTVSLSSGPEIEGVAPFNTGALVLGQGVKNSSGVEEPTSYTVQWSTSSAFTTVAGSKTYPAVGAHGGGPLIVTGLTNSSIYYFRSYATSGGTAVSPYSSVEGPVTIGAPTGGNTVTGTVTFDATATGPLYVIFISSTSIYIDYIASPVSPQAYTIQVPSGTYQLGAILDQNNNGVTDPGDLQNIDQNGGPTATISGPTSNEDLTLPSGGAIQIVNTENQEFVSGSNTSFAYNLQFQIYFLAKLPVTVTLESSSNADGVNVVGPIDVANCNTVNSSCGHGFQFNYQGLGKSAAAGDTYTFNVIYSDGTSGMLTYSLPAVLNAYASNLEPQTGESTSTTPTFTWTDPANAANYVYNFNLTDDSGEVWEIPGENSQGNGFDSSITSITWGTDPTGGGSTPSVSSLSDSTNYSWQIEVVDNYGNQATTNVNYQP